MADLIRYPLYWALLALLTAAPAAVGQQHVWYQVEILLFLNEAATARSAETFTTQTPPTQPAAAVALGPPWPASVRPQHTTELEMIWNGIDAAPRFARLAPAADPETLQLFHWLERLHTHSEPPNMNWLYDLELLVWEPQQAALQSAAIHQPAVTHTVPDPAGHTPSASEIVLADQPAPRRELEPPDEAIPPTTPAQEAAAPDPLNIPIALAFRAVAPNQSTLTRAAARLRRARTYRVLKHLAWRQPFEPEAPPIPVAVHWHEPQSNKLRLAGNVSVALRRYLHLELNLSWMETTRFENHDEIQAIWVPIKQSRRLRSSELHYIDHPRVGALVRITPFTLAQPLTHTDPPVPGTPD